MSLESLISEDQAAIDAAQANLAVTQAAAQLAITEAQDRIDNAVAKLAADQAALDAAKPIVGLLVQIEDQAGVLDEATRTALLSLTAQAKALF